MFEEQNLNGVNQLKAWLNQSLCSVNIAFEENPMTHIGIKQSDSFNSRIE